MPHIYNAKDWPLFHWNADAVAPPLARLRYKQGLFAQRSLALDESSRSKAQALVLAGDAAAGAALSGAPGTAATFTPILDDIARHSAALLTMTRLTGWHSCLNAGPSALRASATAEYPAMPPARLPGELKIFLAWFNFAARPGPEDAPREPGLWSEPLIRAAIAHLWFAALSPFARGSLRLARAVSGLALLRADPGKACYSLDQELLKQHKNYHAALDNALNGSLDISPWLLWFLQTLETAVDNADGGIAPAIKRGLVFEKMQKSPLNERQKLVLALLLNNDKKTKMRSGDYAAAATCSSDTALRDIQELLALGLLRKNKAGGRSTSYSLKM